MSNRSLAHMTPHQLVGTPRFWRDNPSLGIAVGFFVLLTVAVSTLLFVHVRPNIADGQVSLLAKAADVIAVIGNMCILAVCVEGLRRVALHTAEIRINRAIADATRRASEKMLDDTSARLEPGDLPGLLPAVAEGAEVMPARTVFDRVATAARSQRVESSSALTQACREDCGRKLHGITEIPRIGLQIGILGTFIGLMLAVKIVGDSLANTSVAQLDVHFDKIRPELISVLYLTFSKSIVALLVAILLAFVTNPVRRGQSAYLKALDDAVVTFINLALRTRPDDSVLNEILEIKTRVEQGNSALDSRLTAVEGSLDGARRELGAGLGASMEAIRAQTSALSDAARGLRHEGKERAEQLQASLSAQREHVAAVSLALTKATSEQAQAVRGLGEEQGRMMDAFVRQQNTLVQSAAEELRAVVAAANGVISSAAGTQQELLSRVGAYYRDAKELHRALLDGAQKREEEAHVVLAQNIDSVSSAHARALEEGFEKLLTAQRDVIEAIKQAQQEAAVQARREAQAQQEAAVQARREAQAQQEAAAQARREAQAEREAQAQARREAQAQAQREAQARREAQAQVQRRAPAQHEASEQWELEADAGDLPPRSRAADVRDLAVPPPRPARPSHGLAPSGDLAQRSLAYASPVAAGAAGLLATPNQDVGFARSSAPRATMLLARSPDSTSWWRRWLDTIQAYVRERQWRR